ncbi:MAG: heptosyltransferase I [Parcubacteria group bacterium Gr01-1014_91]|nr:MAG: heptosyltransferase I [Parcubacteria group bacterium Gr01-1014_91]
MEIKKALTFRASSIGDCLMGKYLLENIHAQFPNARLGIVVGGSGAMIRDLFSAYPWLEVIEANRYSPRILRSLYRDFCGSDLVVTQYAGKAGGRFGLASKLAARLLAKDGGLIGFTDASPWNKFLYDKLVPISSSDAIAEHDRAALRAAGVPVSLQFPTLQYIKDSEVLSKFNLEAGKYVVVHLFAGNTARGLHADKKRELLVALAEKLPSARLIVTGGASDREEALHAADGLPARVIAGDATLQEMMNLIAQSHGVVSVDTGIAHITAQLGKPLIVLRTCVGRAWWLSGQYGSDAPITVFSCDSVCKNGHIAKAYPACMDAIDIGEVTKKL